jgi:hypothetical protein
MILYAGKLEAIYRQANPFIANFNLLVYRGKMANFMASTTSKKQFAHLQPYRGGSPT